MRDCSKNRAGFDRVLMAVAATFLTVSATSALAQADPARNSAAELAIDAAIPRPEPANVPPPTINDFKLDTTHRCPIAAEKPTEKAAAAQACRLSPPAPAPHRQRRPRLRPPACRARRLPSPPRSRSRPPAACPPADQPVADKLRDMLGAKSSRYFDRKAERAAVEKFYTARDFAPLWTQAGT